MRPSLPLLSILLSVVIWGIGPVFFRTLSVSLGAANHLVIRYSIVALAYLALLAVIGGWRIDREDWPRLLLISILGMVGYNLGSAFGFETASASLGSLVIGTQPLLISLLAAGIAGEALTRPRLLGLVVALLGIAVLFVPDALAARLDPPTFTGAALIFGAGVAWSVYVVASRPLIVKYGAIPVTALSILIASTMMVPVLALLSGRTYETLAAMSARSWMEMAYIAGLATFFATITWNYGASRLPATTTGATLYLVPVIGVAAGALILGEAVTGSMLAGGALVLIGVAIAQFWPA